jgi:hypothetical protein
MTKTIDEQLERLASAQERTATALEGILEAITNFSFTKVGDIAVAGVNVTEDAADAGTDDDPAPEETAPEAATEEPAGKEVEEESVADAEPDEPAEESQPEEPAGDEAAAEGGDDEGDPLGDGDADVDPYPMPAKLTNDTLRNFARSLMEKEGKAAVFEVLAEVGPGYKAVGEVSKDNLRDAHQKMIDRLKG